MNRAQRKFGSPGKFATDKILPYLNRAAQEFIQYSPFVVIATSNKAGDCDASPRGGKPGFIKVLNEQRLLIPDVSGNRLFQSYENIETNSKAGLIFFIPGCRITVRVNGRVRVTGRDEMGLESAEVEVFGPDEHSSILQSLILEIDQVYPHCTKALDLSRLWSIDSITQNKKCHSERAWTQKWLCDSTEED